MEKSIFSAVLVLVFAASAFAQGEAAQGGLFGGGMGGLLPLILIFVFFYLFLLRPQQKKAKEHAKLLNALKKDDRVITSGGVYATVVSVKGNIIEAKIADGVNIQIAKQSIGTVITKQEEDAAQVEVVKK
ncbi:preprotein translocase subunit YajC [Endomicrobium proavitum]|uniref:Sec translocon accessory complex subunit YajC n=1 Tax=Endomicrobium proavitum TaxID=1408281 RepID=A0A0G3WKA6_9BACT|nr:preprotein translocase subunit YajC [Endomicrobium proavitum]AKL97929.1 preprotein translocase, YajC subunit [Endomicrobium proavitum]